MEPLRAVDATPDTTDSRRRAKRGKPSQPLPTDRMKLDAQRRVLRTVGNLSADRRPISVERLSDAINKEVSHYTVGLSHGFFVACGWLTRVGRGEYVATDALINYSRRLAADDADTANAVLRDAVTNSDSWFWKVIHPQVDHGAARLSEVVVALMDAADVGEANRPQVKMLLDWLAAIGLIAIAGDKISLTASASQSTATPDGDDGDDGDGDGDGDAQAGRTAAEVPQPTIPVATQDDGGWNHPVPLLSFGFSVTLTAEDLAKLSPEQIEAVYAAVGKLAAIKKS